MKIKLIIVPYVMFCMMFLGACASLAPKQAPPSAKVQKAVDSRPVNAYYLFAEAHLDLKQGKLDRAIDRMQQALVLDPESVYLKRELANMWLLKKNTGEAVRLLETILAHHPDDVDTLILLGRVRQSSDPQQAADALERVIALDPSRENVYLVLGGIYMDQEQWDPAKAVYEKLVTKFPGAYAGYFFLGRISAIQGEDRAAESYFRKTLQLEPRLAEPYFELGAIYEAQGSFKKAEKAYGEVLKQNPDNIQAQMALAHVHFQSGKKKKAAEELAQLGRMSIDDGEVVRVLVRSYLDTQNYAAASIILNGMMAGAPDHSDLNYLAGVALDGEGKKKAAITQFRKVKPTSRFYQNAAVHAALLYQELDELDTAIAFLHGVIDKDPQNPEFRLYLGSFYEQTEAYDKAEAALKEGLVLDPNNSRLYFRLGVVYDKLGRKDDSIAAMEKVIHLDPENANALNYLGYTYADMGVKLGEAEQLIRRALKQKPGDGYIIDSLAWVFYKRGQYDEALPLMEQAVTLVPDDPVVREHLGDVYSRLGLTQKALQSYRRAIENGHSDKTALNAKIRALSP